NDAEEQQEAQMSKRQWQNKEKAFGEGDHLVSWIWLTEGAMGDGSDGMANQGMLV
ncbi:hypothetical protein ARMGADRAFT_895963, partial [Armillaria gallica]